MAVNLFVKSDVRFLFFGENFLLLEGRRSFFLSASRSQFVLTRPAKKIENRSTDKVFTAKMNFE